MAHFLQIIVQALRLPHILKVWMGVKSSVMSVKKPCLGQLSGKSIIGDNWPICLSWPHLH